MALRTVLRTNLEITKTGGRFQLPPEDCPLNVRHTDLHHRAGMIPAFYITVTSAERVGLSVARGSYKNVVDSSERNMSMAHLLYMKDITIPMTSVWTEYGYLQHSGVEWTGSHSFSFHLSPLLHSHPLMYKVTFSRGCTFKTDNDFPSSNIEGNERLRVVFMKVMW